MTARISDISNGIAGLLTAGLAAQPSAFPLTFEIVSTYIPRHKPEELSDRKLYIVPVDNVSERSAKRMFSETFEVSLAIQFKPAQAVGEDAACDAQLELAEAIIDFLRITPLANQAAVFQGSRYEPLFDGDHLDSWGVLTTVIVLSYQGWE